MKFSRFYVDVSALQRKESLDLLDKISMQSFMVLHEESFKLGNMEGFEFLTNSDMTCDEVISAFKIPSNCPVEGVRMRP